MKEVLLDAKNSFIGAWYLEDTSLCDDLITFFEEQKQLQVPGKVGYNSGVKVDERVKKSIDIPLIWDMKISQRYTMELQKVLEQYKVKYPESDNVPKYVIEDVNIQKYPLNGGYYDWHCERSSNPAMNRHLVFMTYLNDVNDEGGTEFKYQELTVTPKKGLTLIWPVDWTHTHRGIPSPTEIKYIATGWYKFEELF